MGACEIPLGQYTKVIVNVLRCSTSHITNYTTTPLYPFFRFDSTTHNILLMHSLMSVVPYLFFLFVLTTILLLIFQRKIMIVCFYYCFHFVCVCALIFCCSIAIGIEFTQIFTRSRIVDSTLCLLLFLLLVLVPFFTYVIILASFSCHDWCRPLICVRYSHFFPLC